MQTKYGHIGECQCWFTVDRATTYIRNDDAQKIIKELEEKNRLLIEGFQKAADRWRSSISMANELLIESGDICGEEMEDGSMDYFDETEDPEYVQNLLNEVINEKPLLHKTSEVQGKEKA